MRRQSLADDIEAFLKAGTSIQQIPDGVSAQDPKGRGPPLRLGNPEKKAENKSEDPSGGESGEQSDEKPATKKKA